MKCFKKHFITTSIVISILNLSHKQLNLTSIVLGALYLNFFMPRIKFILRENGKEEKKAFLLAAQLKMPIKILLL